MRLIADDDLRYLQLARSSVNSAATSRDSVEALRYLDDADAYLLRVLDSIAYLSSEQPIPEPRIAAPSVPPFQPQWRAPAR